MNGHLGKPLDIEAMLQVLRQHLYAQKPAKDRRKTERRVNRDDRRQAPDRRRHERRKG